MGFAAGLQIGTGFAGDDVSGPSLGSSILPAILTPRHNGLIGYNLQRGSRFAESVRRRVRAAEP